MLDSAQVENVMKELDLKEVPSQQNIFAKIPLPIWIFLAVLIITIILAITYFLLPQSWKNRVTGKDPNVWTPPSNVTSEILGGRQAYSIQGGTAGLPKITQLILDPQDAKKGITQTVDVKAENATPIKDVKIVLHLDDNKEFEYNLVLAEGTNTGGIWRISYPFPYTFNQAYRVTVKARNENNLGNMSTVSIR